MRRRLLALALTLVLATLTLPSSSEADGARGDGAAGAGAGAGAGGVPVIFAQTVRNPVVIVAGTFSPEFINETLAGRLRAEGLSVSVFVLPSRGLGDIHTAARALATRVDAVRTQFGATKVDLIGHSQGGLVARDYVKFLGGASTVDKVIGLGAPNHGAAVANVLSLLGLGSCLGVVACRQMSIGSGYLAALNEGDDSIGDVRYTNIATKLDEVVRPYQSSFLDPADGNIVNLAVQDECVGRVVGHVGLIFDGAVFTGVRQALAGRTNLELNCCVF